MKTHTLGFPRMGARRELELALERYWHGELPPDVLMHVAQDVRVRHWLAQRHAGLDFAAAGDFSLCDTMLDHALMFGAVPPRFGFDAGAVSLRQYFELARGNAAQAALQPAKWFDTDDHYLVPELAPDQTFSLHAQPLIEAVREVENRSFMPKPVILGPLTFLWLSKVCGLPDGADEAQAKLALLPRLLPVYRELLKALEARAVSWVQIDEPVLALDLPDAWVDALKVACEAIAPQHLQVLLATYFGSVERHLPWLASLPINGLHLDLVQAPQQAATALAHWPRGKVLSAGVIDGLSSRRADLRALLVQLKPLQSHWGHRLWLAPSCSLQHCPAEPSARACDASAFAVEKLDELGTLRRALLDGEAAEQKVLDASDAAWRQRRRSRQ